MSDIEDTNPIVNIVPSPGDDQKGLHPGPRESPLNSANTSKVTMCSDPPLFQPYCPDSSSQSNQANDDCSTNIGRGSSATHDRSLTSPPRAEGSYSSGIDLPSASQRSQRESMEKFAAESEVAATEGLIEAECQQVLAVKEENTKWLAKKDREIEVLELTREQLAEMVSEDAGLTKDEYFDLNYLATEAGKVWKGRVMTDPDSELTSSRLFPNSASPLRSIRHRPTSPSTDQTGGKQQQLALLDPSDDPLHSGLDDPSRKEPTAFEKKHPIMFRKMQRNKSRREVFNASMQQRNQDASTSAAGAVGGMTVNTSGLPSAIGDSSLSAGSPTASGTGPRAARSIAEIRATLKAQGPLVPVGGLGSGAGKHLQSAAHITSLRDGPGTESNKSKSGVANANTSIAKKKPAPVKKAVGNEEEQPEEGEAKEGQATGTDAEAPAEKTVEKEEEAEVDAAPKTLAELLKDQKVQLAQTEKRDQEVYKPLLKSFMEYENNARNKLTQLIEKCASENAALEEAQRLEEEQKAKEKRLIDEGLDE